MIIDVPLIVFGMLFHINASDFIHSQYNKNFLFIKKLIYKLQNNEIKKEEVRSYIALENPLFLNYLQSVKYDIENNISVKEVKFYGTNEVYHFFLTSYLLYLIEEINNDKLILKIVKLQERMMELEKKYHALLKSNYTVLEELDIGTAIVAIGIQGFIGVGIGMMIKKFFPNKFVPAFSMFRNDVLVENLRRDCTLFLNDDITINELHMRIKLYTNINKINKRLNIIKKDNNIESIYSLNLLLIASAVLTGKKFNKRTSVLIEVIILELENIKKNIVKLLAEL